MYLSIHTHAHITGTPHLLKDAFVLALSPCNDWRKQHNTRTFGQIENCIDDLLDGLLANLASTLWTVRMADARIQQAHIVVNLRNGSHRRTRIMRGAFLVDRDSGGETIDMINIRFLHFIEKLPRIGRERLNIAALPFGKNSIKSQATFT